MNLIIFKWVLANSDEYHLCWHASQSIQRVQNSHMVKLSGCDQTLQSDWSWWNSTGRIKLYR